jgi:hypothetical protein
MLKVRPLQGNAAGAETSIFSRPINAEIIARRRAAT